MAAYTVWLRCPACGHQWHAATIDPDLWWGASATPETVAKQIFCPQCQQPPPMQIAATDPAPAAGDPIP